MLEKHFGQAGHFISKFVLILVVLGLALFVFRLAVDAAAVFQSIIGGPVTVSFSLAGIAIRIPIYSLAVVFILLVQWRLNKWIFDRAHKWLEGESEEVIREHKRLDKRHEEVEALLQEVQDEWEHSKAFFDKKSADLQKGYGELAEAWKRYHAERDSQ